ncbi:MAG: multidrug efflux RND transporter permease subunit [Porticoccaceae bacterium]|nr:multidrug efflux RND transporter permease subunit [Porticoccaceae bacterium]
MAEFFVRRPIVAMVIAIIIVLLGLISLGGLPVAQYPEITPPMVNVTATYQGANSVDVEQSVATPVEQKVNGVENMIYMKSTNASNGAMTLQVSFEVGTDLDMANVLVQNRVSEAMAMLPEQVTRQGVTVKKKLSFPLLLISLISPQGTYDDTFLMNYATINIIDELARIRGVGLAEVLGSSQTEYSMRVWIKPDQLSKLALTVPDITAAIKQQNVLVPAGQIGGPPAPAGTEFTYTVQTGGRFETAEEFGKVIVRANPDGSHVLLKDVARIELGTQGYLIKSTLDGTPSALLQVFQLPDANGLEVAEKVIATLDKIAEKLPDDVEYVVSLDTTKPVTAGIREIVITLFQALALVILVVYIFLQSARATFIPALAVPVSLIGAFAVFPLLGFSINTLSLLGLVLAIGIVVDDAIVVVEAVTSKMEAGMAPREATVAAMREVSGPIVATSLALIAVFVPVAMMPGITGLLYQQFAITIAVAVAISSINALTLSPALAATLLKPPGEEKSPMDGFFAVFNRWFEKLTGRFLKLVGFFTEKLIRAGLLMAAIIVGLVVLIQSLPAGFVPGEDQGYIMAAVMLPDAASLQRTEEVMHAVEGVVAGIDAIENSSIVSGYSMLTGTVQSNAGFVFIQLKDWDQRPEARDHATQIVRRLNMALSQKIKGAVAFAFAPPPIPGIGTGSGFTMMLQDRSGNPPEYLAEQSAAFIKAINEHPIIAQAYTVYRANSPQLLLNIDDSKALKLGVSLQDLQTSVGAFLGGAYVNDFNRFGRLYKVFVQAEPEYRADPDGLRFFYVRNKDGNMVPLSTLVDISRTSGTEFTNRFNLYRSAEISGQPAAGYSSAQALAALEEVAAQVLPDDISYSWGNMSYQEKAASGSGTVVFAMALVFVFLVLAAQYESWSLPLSVLAGTPIAIFGAIGGLWLARLMSDSYENNVFAQIGLVMLIGMAAKNSILIVEFAKLEMEKGKPAREAAMEAARQRFRPILMTAFSFILGVLPLLVASGAGAEARKIMGMTVFSGMLVATVVGVLLVPAMFVAVERYLGGSKTAAPTEPEADAGSPDLPESSKGGL